MNRILYKEESYKLIGACFEVYKQKGSGFTEPVYQECLAVEFALQKIPFVVQPEIQMSYKGRLLTQFFKPDFICYEKIIVEIKAMSGLIDAHRSQALNYLNATGFESAILVNFGEFPKLKYERLAKSQRRESNISLMDEIRSWNLANS
ncbi:MAG TPA: GxxExxY protein [Pyrinomonadaceae bacterium]|jgi:GxxExxY protein|nr:GxxExxY protein [Pyrinomonadaceae bacterium]